MSITTTGNLPAPILQSLAPGMLSVPTPNFNYIIPAEKYSMPRQGGTTMRFLRPVPLVAPVVQLGNIGIEPPSQVATREIVDAAMAFYGTSVILNEQVVIQDQDPVLSWVTERLGVAMRQAEDIILRDFLLSSASVYNCKGGVDGRQNGFIAVVKSSLMDLKILTLKSEDNKAQAEQYALAA